MKDLVKSSTLLGSTEIAIMAVSVVRAKYLAVNIGPEGYGQYAMLASFFTILTAICGGWIARGTIKYIAEYRSKEDLSSVAKVHNYSISTALILGSLALLFVFIFHDFVREKFLSPEILLWHYSLFAASFLATSLTTFFGWLLQGFMMIRQTVLLRISLAVFNLISIVGLVYFFELTGYFLSILMSSLFGLFIYWRTAKKVIPTRFVLPSFKSAIYQKILRFGSVSFLLLVINNVCEYVQRLFVLTALNISSVGLFQVATSITGYMGIANRGSLFVNDSKMSQDLNEDETSISLNHFLRFNILLGIPIALGLILFSGELILIMYSSKFVQLSSMLFFFVAGQFFAFLVGGFQGVMLGKSFLKMHAFISITYSVITVLIPLFFIRDFGLSVIGISILIANVVTLMVDYFYLKIKLRIKIHTNVIVIFTIALICFSISYVLQFSALLYRTVFFMICMVVLVITISKAERKQLFKLITRREQ